MNNILILYPKQFKCLSKFNRKITNILQNIASFSVLFPDDPNGFILEVFQDKSQVVQLIHKTDWIVDDITHAIIFDDGEEFPDETKIIEKNEIPLRKVNISITRVINIKDHPEYKGKKSTSSYEYIGRGSYWGNPYSMYEEGDDREEVIRKYKYDFENNLFPNKEISKIYKLAGKRLGCFCKPASCHGDILADFLNRWDDGK